MNVAQAIAAAVALGLERLDAQLLMLHALARPAHDRAWLLAHDTDALPPAAQATFDTCLQRRLAGEPLAYITGHKEFFGLDLQVDARVLVPRPDLPPYGAGEASLKPTMAAVANAIYDATGVRIRRVPFRDDRVLAALKAAGV